VLLLDEPTNHLDHATAYCEQLVLLQAGQVVATGKPEEVLNPDQVAKVNQDPITTLRT
jgi:ABC-type cobalamin/Fe3+-siderophores transport system ATPase subunit